MVEKRRRGVGVVKRRRFEIGWGLAAPRGFESHPLRHTEQRSWLAVDAHRVACAGLR